MGVFDFFRRRRERESAIPPSETPQELASFASAEGQPIVGRPIADDAQESQVGGLSGADGLVELIRLGPMIQRAITEGTVQIETGPAQVIGMGGSGLREEIAQIMRAHGIDPDDPSAQGRRIDAGSIGDMQAQILAALARRGVDLGSHGSIQVDPDEAPPSSGGMARGPSG